MPLIAIDGPVGSGKSTVARAVADRLGLRHLDTGAMYRSVALAVRRQGVDADSAEGVVGVARAVRIEVGEQVRLDGADVTAEIRGSEVNRTVSQVASHSVVREEMVGRQRAWAAAHGGGVVEGRDIGTVVFPDADLKVFLTASDEERARRRSRDEEAADLARRDRLDSTRSTSPLQPAPDAVVIDTTDLSVDEIVDDIVARLGR